MSREIQTVPIVFANTGIIIKSAPDEIPMTAYKMLSNAQTDRENSVSVRKGFTRLNDGLPSPPYSAYFLKDFNNLQWRYAITSQQLYTAPVLDPGDASVWPLGSGNSFLPVDGGGRLSSANDPRALFATFSLSGTEMKPYAFIADGTAFLKHAGGQSSALRVGIPRPANPITTLSVSPVSDSLLEDCNDVTLWSSGNPARITAPLYPSSWFYGLGSLDARWVWAKYTFVLNDSTETYCSSAYVPHYIAKNFQANLFWKPSTLIDTLGAYIELSGPWDSPDQIGYPGAAPVGARVRGVRIRSGSVIDQVQVLWALSDGTTQDGFTHGGNGGAPHDFILDFDEYITGIKGNYGLDIETMIIVTNKRESVQYGNVHTSNAYSLSVPAPNSTQSSLFIGFQSAVNNNVLTGLGLVIRQSTFNAAATPPGTAVGWNAYVGDSPNNVHLVNSTPNALADILREPPGGFVSTGEVPPQANSATIVTDPSGHTGNAIQMQLTGDGLFGSATKVITNAQGYPIVMDLGTFDSTESFKIWINLANAEANSNISSLSLAFVLSNIPGDTGSFYNYIATATKTDLSGFTPGSWQVVQFYKSDFVLNNYGGGGTSDIGWNTVTALNVEVTTKDPSSGAKTCFVSFDDIYFSPVGKLTGVDYQWTYTYYNSKTGTESDYADLFANPLGALLNQAVLLTFPLTPLTNAPLANPDTIRIYRIGGTVSSPQLVTEIDYVPGFGFTYLDNVSDTLLGKVLDTDNQLPPDGVSGCEIYDNRLWTWGGTLGGVSEPLNRLRFSKSTLVEEFPADNFIYVGSGNEEIKRVLEHDGELFIFTSTKVYRIVGQDITTYRAVSSAVNQGLTNSHCVSRGPHGLYMRAYDGIYEFPSGRKISEPINQVFFGENLNGVDPAAPGRSPEEAMGFYDSKMFFSYCASTDPSIKNDRTLIWDIIYERWGWYIYGAQDLFFEPENNILIGCNLTQWFDIVAGAPVDVRQSGNYPMQLETGFADQCADGFHGIPCVIDTREYDLGFPDQEKQFIDLTVDADTQGYPIQLLASFDGAPFDTLGVIETTGRDRIVLPVVLGDENSKYAVRMSLRAIFESDVSATSSTRIYKIAHRFLVEPMRHNIFVTDWSEYGSPGPKFFHKLWVEMDTRGHPLNSIEFQLDQSTAKTITQNIATNGRQKLYYGLGVDVRGTLGRLKFINDGVHEFKIYDHGFDIIPEPPLVNTWQTPWTDVGFPYRKLWKHVEFDVDTDGDLIEFNFWLDGNISQAFSIQTVARQHIVQSLDSEQFGKIGRITVDAPPLGADGLPQGVRTYGDPLFVVEQRNPEVTIADSFEHILDNERIKIIRRLWLVIDNPNDIVNLAIYVDNVFKGNYPIPVTTGLSPKLEERRIDVPGGLKGRLMRFVFTSKQSFEIDWQKCQVLLRDVNTEDGYRAPQLQPPTTY